MDRKREEAKGAFRKWLIEIGTAGHRGLFVQDPVPVMIPAQIIIDKFLELHPEYKDFRVDFEEKPDSKHSVDMRSAQKYFGYK